MSRVAKALVSIIVIVAITIGTACVTPYTFISLLFAFFCGAGLTLAFVMLIFEISGDN